jgi:hypothetical protein
MPVDLNCGNTLTGYYSDSKAGTWSVKACSSVLAPGSQSVTVQ